MASAAPVVVDTSSSAAATEGSFQRKTFFDTVNQRHWLFYYNGTEIEYSYSIDGESWNVAGSLSYNTNNFSLVFRDIAGTAYLFFVAEDNDFDVVLRRGELDPTSIVFDVEQTVYDGTAADDRYRSPSVALNGSNNIWVSSQYARIGHQTVVRVSTNVATGDLSLWEAVSEIGESSNKLNAAVLVSQLGQEMYLLVSGDNNQVSGYKFDGANWSLANSGGEFAWFDFNSRGFVGGSINSVVVHGSDIYVGGTFTEVARNAKAQRIARFDGHTWHELGEGLNGLVNKLLVVGDDLYVGGNFTDAGGTGSDRIARWDIAEQAWYPLASGLSAQVSTMSVLGDDIYVGGLFINAGGTGSDRVARWNSVDEQWEALGTGLNNSVVASEVVGTNVYFGGTFTNGGGTGSDRIVRWDSVDEEWEGIGAGINNNTVFTLAASGTDLYVGGSFTNVGDANGDGVVRLNTTNDSWSSLGAGIPVTAFSRVSNIAVSGANVYATGGFLNAGGNGAADYLAHWNGASWNPFVGGVFSGVANIYISGGEFYFGGSFSNAGGVANADVLAKWDGTVWHGFLNVDEVFNNPTFALAIIGNDIFIGGEFTDAAGIAAADRIVRFDGQQWHALGSGLNGTVRYMRAVGTDLYIAGDFTNGGGTGSNNIVRWDTVGQQWHPLGTGSNGSGINSIAVVGTDLYIGGNMFDVGGTGTDGIARWDTVAQQWEGLGVGLGEDIDGWGLVFGIEAIGTDVYVGGSFTEAGGNPAEYFARLDTTTDQWFAVPGVNGRVLRMFSDGTDIYLAGQFTDAGGVPEADGIARWDGSSWYALGTGITFPFIVLPITASMFYNGELYISGGFNSADGDNTIAANARFDGTSWHAVEGRSATASGLAAIGNTIYRTGYFSVTEPFAIYREVAVSGIDDEIEISALSNSAGDVHVAYTDESGVVNFRTFDENDGAWGDELALSASGAVNPALTFNATSGTLTAAWMQSSALTYSAAQSPYSDNNWSAPVAIYNIDSNRGLTLPLEQETDDLLLGWTSGSADPFNVLSDLLLMTVSPTVVISSDEVSPTNSATIPITVTFSANVTGFVEGDIAVTNATKSNFVAVNGSTYTLDLTPSGQGAITVNVAAAVAVDAFANDNLAASQFLIVYDSVAPTVSIVSGVSGYAKTSPIPITIQFSETVTGFVVGDITLTNATAGNFVAVDGDTYTANIIPLANGTVTVNIAAAAAEDGAGNDNTAAASQLSFIYDTVAPSLVISTTASNPTPTAPIPVTFEFSENVTGFVAGDVVVTNGVLSNFVAVDGNTYQANVVPSADGVVRVSVAAGVSQDAATNLSTAAKRLSLTYQSPDSDGDGISDATELNDGTNPADSGSFLAELPTSWCSDWNGFLGMYNINEYVNLTSTKRVVVPTLFDLEGEAKSSLGLDLIAGAQTDLLVHDMPHWTRDSYGKVCSEVLGASSGDVDGRMVYYKPSLTTAGYDFAFALPYYDGLRGDQFLTFNNMQPSANAADRNNFVANWIQVTNLEDTEQRGTLYFYRQDGTIVSEQVVTLAAEARYDFSAHDIAPNQVGMIQWKPVSSSAKFGLRNTRYYYDNQFAVNSFDAALQIEGVRGSGELLSTALDTRGQLVVLEVANAKATAVNVVVNIYNSAGVLQRTENFNNLGGYNSRHIVINGILNEELGSATIKGSAVGSVAAVAMHYGKDALVADYSVEHVYGVIAQQPLGETVRGSYNTYLGQGCELQLANSSGSAVTGTVKLTRLDGTVVLSGHQIVTPAKGSSSFDVCAQEEANQYGVVTVELSHRNTVSSVVLRHGANGEYRFVTPVR